MQLKASHFKKKYMFPWSLSPYLSVGGAELQGEYACEEDVDAVKGMETWKPDVWVTAFNDFNLYDNHEHHANMVNI